MALAYEGAIAQLIDAFAGLPGIGPKGAQRIAFYLLGVDEAKAQHLADAIIEVKAKVRFCEICGNVCESSPCPICVDPRRDHSVICVVQEPKDVMSIERTREYRGLYHVLGGAIDPMSNIGPADLAIPQLLKRLAPLPNDEQDAATAEEQVSSSSASPLNIYAPYTQSATAATAVTTANRAAATTTSVASTSVANAVNAANTASSASTAPAEQGANLPSALTQVSSDEQTDTATTLSTHQRRLTMYRDLREDVQEVILALNPDIEGDATTRYLAQLLAPFGITITRLASGLPVGSDLEYADEITLGRAISGRRQA